MEIDAGIVYSFAADFLKEDLGRGDITTQATVRGAARARGSFLAKQDFVLCGLEFAEAVFAVLDSMIQIESRAYDGDRITAGTRFAQVDGPAAVLLAGERTALNLVQRMSGVATLTREYVDRLAGTNARIVDTRKTTPGLRLIEKYAVSVGGGHNHRFGLDDGVLIKDNHIAMAGGIKRAVELARAGVSHLLKIEIEVSNAAQAREAIESGAQALLLDNMSHEDLRNTVKLIRETAPDTIIEASGGVNLNTVRELAETGVDLISVGAITHSAPAVDISMKIAPI
ncbi:MAG TPA: carboxylating nicotinate-nucleotide diphosphorylase [Blastocatellia bacterium]|nr:carboxylating nicotinate-nucleotide diphosphorylase [Blastocatellia bacterium]